MDSLLLELAVRGTNSKTTRALHCRNRDLRRQLQEMDIWRRKFEYSFPTRPYYTWWTAKDNYLLQEYDQPLELAFLPENRHCADFLLYKSSPLRNRLFYATEDSLDLGKYISQPQLVPVYFKQAHQKYLLFYEEYEYDMEEFTSVESFAEAKAKIKEFFLNRLKEGSELIVTFLVVDLSKLVLELSLPKDMDGYELAYQVAKNNDAKRAWCWHLDPEKVKKVWPNWRILPSRVNECLL